VTKTPTLARTPRPEETVDAVSTALRTATPRPSATRTPEAATATLPPPTPSNGLLLNGGFEAMESDELLGWDTYGGDAAQVDAPVRSGEHAGAFTSSTESTKWLYQPVQIGGGAWYTFSAFVQPASDAVESAFLRISWYASGDATGSALSSTDSTEELTEPRGDFHELSTGSVQAPLDARSAKARVVVRPRGAEAGTVFVDDAWFVSSEAVSEDDADPADEGFDDPDGAESRGHTAPARGSGTSAVAGVARRVEPVPQPSPVIRRNESLGTVEDTGQAGSMNWWRWVIPPGATLVVAGTGWFVVRSRGRAEE
jgi:hypothetical protein